MDKWQDNSRCCGTEWVYVPEPGKQVNQKAQYVDYANLWDDEQPGVAAAKYQAELMEKLATGFKAYMEKSRGSA